MKKAPLTVIVISMFFVTLIVGTGVVNFGEANPTGGQEMHISPPIISFSSPINNTCINSVMLNFTLTAPTSWLSEPISFEYEPGSGLAQKLVSVSCYVDGQLHELIDANDTLVSPLNYSLFLLNLKDGVHNVKVYADAMGVWRNWVSDEVSYVPINSSSQITFILDTNVPKFSAMSVRNSTYSSNNIPLNFIINEQTSSLSYSLDNKANITITGNATLAELSEGSHSLVVYANDTAGNIGKSDTILFNINTQPSPSSNLAPSPSVPEFPTWIILFLLAVGVVFCTVAHQRKRQLGS